MKVTQKWVFRSNEKPIEKRNRKWRFSSVYILFKNLKICLSLWYLRARRILDMRSIKKKRLPKNVSEFDNGCSSIQTVPTAVLKAEICTTLDLCLVREVRVCSIMSMADGAGCSNFIAKNMLPNSGACPHVSSALLVRSLVQLNMCVIATTVIPKVR